MGRVESKDVASKDLFKPIADSAAAAEKKLETLSTELQNVIKLQAKVAKTVKSSASGFNKLAAAETKSKNALTEKEKVDKRLIVLQKKTTQVTKIQRERLAALRLEEQRRNKIAKESAQLTNKNIGAFDRLTVKIKSLSTQYKNLVIQEGKETKQSRLLKKQILQLNAARTKATVAIQANTAANRRGIGVMGRFRERMTQLGLAFGAFAILRSAFGIVKNFDQATADLASVLGVTTDQMAKLTEQSKELGATTIFTASEVAELQKEYAKLGFTQDEIIGVTEATLELAAATGTELGTAATVVGSTLRAFGLDVSETQRVVDVMAKSFSASSLDMEKFTVAMRAVAPIAKSAGFSIEQTTALIGTLTDAGVDASTAGTGLRNVFLAMAEGGFTLEEALDKIRNSSNKNLTSLELFGKRGAVIGTVLADAGVSVDALTGKLENSGGAAEEMANTQLDTLGGSIKLLISAWEGWILKMNESGGVGETLKNVIKFLAENLDLILDTVLNVAKAFVLFKTAVKAATLSTKAFGKSVSKVKLNAFAVALTAIVFIAMELYEQFTRINASQEAFARVTDTVNDAVDDEIVKMKGLRDQLLKTNTASKERQVIINKINAEYGTTLENLKSEAAFLKQIELAYRDIIKQIRLKSLSQALGEELVTAQKELLQISREIKNSTNEFEKAGLLVIQGEIEDKIVGITNSLADLQLQSESTIEGKGGIGELTDRFGKVEDKTKGATKAVKDLKLEMEDFDIEDFQNVSTDFGDDDVDRVGDIDVSEDASATAEALRAIDLLAIKEKELWKSIRSEVANTTKMITDMYETRLSLIDKEIEAKQVVIDKSKEREDQLRADAKERGLDASESINEERDRQKKALADQQDLARKKIKIEALIGALALLTAKIEQGEGNPVKNVKSQITNLKSFIDGAFYDGTEYTVADALGRTNSRDGHNVLIDDNESVLTGAQTRAMNIRKGGNSTDDIVNIYKGNVQRKTDSLRNSLDVKNRPNDTALLNKVDQLIKVTQSQPNQGKNTFNAVIGALQHQVGKTKYIYPVRKK